MSCIFMFERIDVESGVRHGYIQIYVSSQTHVNTDFRAYIGVDTGMIAQNDGNKNMTTQMDIYVSMQTDIKQFYHE